MAQWLEPAWIELTLFDLRSLNRQPAIVTLIRRTASSQSYRKVPIMVGELSGIMFVNCTKLTQI